MKKFVAASAIALLIAILAIPSFPGDPVGAGVVIQQAVGVGIQDIVGRLTKDTETSPLKSEKTCIKMGVRIMSGSHLTPQRTDGLAGALAGT